MADSSATPTARKEPLGRLVAVVLLATLFSAFFAGFTALQVKGFSLYDELTHSDYAFRVAHGEVPSAGSKLAPQVRAEAACRGFAMMPDQHFPKIGRCGDPSPPFTVARGENFNFAHPPVYYAVTGVVARIGDTVTADYRFMTFARLTGVLWLAAAVVVLYLAMRRFGVGWWTSLLGALLMISLPMVFYADATVTNDAPAVLCGALAMFLLARVLVDGRRGLVLPAVLATAATATKVMSGLPFLLVAFACLVLALRAVRTDRRDAVRLGGVAVVILVSFAVVHLGWEVFQSGRGDSAWTNPVAGANTVAVSGLPIDEVFGPSFRFPVPFGSDVRLMPPALDNLGSTLMVRVWGLIVLAAIGAVLALRSRWSPAFVVAALAAVGGIAWPWVVEVQAAMSGWYFPAPTPRYALALTPLFLLTVVLAVDGKRLVRSFTVFSAIAFAVSAYTVLHA